MKWIFMGWVLSRFFVLDMDVDIAGRRDSARGRVSPTLDTGRLKIMDGGVGAPPTGH